MLTVHVQVNPAGRGMVYVLCRDKAANAILRVYGRSVFDMTEICTVLCKMSHGGSKHA